MNQTFVSPFVCAVALLATQTASDPRREVQQYLTRNNFSASEISSLEAGEVVAQASAAGSEEVVVIAAVKIRAPRQRVLDYYGQMISYVDGKVTLAFGRFSTPPALGDVKNLSFDGDEISDLRSCKPGDCDIRLGGAAIEALQK